jgi:hypothetical protein
MRASIWIKSPAGGRILNRKHSRKIMRHNLIDFFQMSLKFLWIKPELSVKVSEIFDLFELNRPNQRKIINFNNKHKSAYYDIIY